MHQKPIHCLNCEHIIEDSQSFCSHCGQSVKDSHLSIKRLLNDSLSVLFNLDSRLIHTLKDIFKPSKLSQFYVEGKRKYYVNPIRLFFFTLIILITFFLYLSGDSIRLEFLDGIRKDVVKENLYHDFLTAKEKFADTSDYQLIDSLSINTFGSEMDTTSSLLMVGNFNFFGLKLSDYKITKKDALLLSQDSVYQKYNVEGFWNKLVVGKVLKMANDPSGGIKFILKNFSWLIAIQVLLMAVFMKVLFIRKNYYYLEHLILILYRHSLMFLILILSLLWISVLDTGEETIILLAPLSFIILIFSLRKFYRLSRFKAFVYSVVYEISYYINFFILFLATAIVSFLIL